MAIKNMNFTFGKCTDCGKTIKIDVGAIIDDIKCECVPVAKEPQEDKPRTRRRREDATESV